MTSPMIPDAEQVAVAWAKSLSLLVGTAVATDLPAATAWPTVSGGSRAFLQVIGTGGGTVRDTPLRTSVVSFDAYGVKTDSDRPPKAMTSHILSDLLGRTMGYENGSFPAMVTVANGAVATVHSAWPVTEHARRIPDQDTSRAHYSLDIAIMWTWNKE